MGSGLDLCSIEVLLGPIGKLFHLTLFHIAFAAVGGGKAHPFALFALIFEYVSHHQVAHCGVAFRLAHQAGLIHGHYVALSLLPLFETSIVNANKRIAGHIGYIVVGHAHAIPVVVAVEHLQRHTHDALCGHFGTVAAGCAQRSHR